MELEGSLPLSQTPATGPYLSLMNLTPILPPCLFMIFFFPFTAFRWHGMARPPFMDGGDGLKKMEEEMQIYWIRSRGHLRNVGPPARGYDGGKGGLTTPHSKKCMLKNITHCFRVEPTTVLCWKHRFSSVKHECHSIFVTVVATVPYTQN
jgi:hypothetical protein